MKYFVIIVLFICLVDNVYASEIKGTISTDPNKLPGNQINPPASGPASAIPTVKKEVSSSGMILPVKNSSTVQTKASGAEKQIIKVLGIEHYHDGSLLRGGNHKIYLLQGTVRKYIANLPELQRFRGQLIIDVSDEVLTQYQIRGHLNGELIREKGTVRVYVIEQGRKKHILNLHELRAHYFGLEIFNINREEMALY
jgi:hypothetical protein